MPAAQPPPSVVERRDRVPRRCTGTARSAYMSIPWPEARAAASGPRRRSRRGRACGTAPTGGRPGRAAACRAARRRAAGRRGPPGSPTSGCGRTTTTSAASSMRCAADLTQPSHVARQLVGGALAEQPAVDARDLDRVHVRHASCCGRSGRGRCRWSFGSSTSRTVRIGSTISSRSGPTPRWSIVRAQPARHADVVLATLVAEADEAVEHVVVLVQPHVGGEAHLPAGRRSSTRSGRRSTAGRSRPRPAKESVI